MEKRPRVAPVPLNTQEAAVEDGDEVSVGPHVLRRLTA